MAEQTPKGCRVNIMAWPIARCSRGTLRCFVKHKIPQAPAVDLSALRREMEELMFSVQRHVSDLVHDAASWREAADHTSGATAAKLTADALENEAAAAKVEAWADTLEAILTKYLPREAGTPAREG